MQPTPKSTSSRTSALPIERLGETPPPAPDEGPLGRVQLWVDTAGDDEREGTERSKAKSSISEALEKNPRAVDITVVYAGNDEEGLKYACRPLFITVVQSADALPANDADEIPPPPQEPPPAVLAAFAALSDEVSPPDDVPPPPDLPPPPQVENEAPRSPSLATPESHPQVLAARAEDRPLPKPVSVGDGPKADYLRPFSNVMPGLPKPPSRLAEASPAKPQPQLPQSAGAVTAGERSWSVDELAAQLRGSVAGGYADRVHDAVKSIIQRKALLGAEFLPVFSGVVVVTSEKGIDETMLFDFVRIIAGESRFTKSDRLTVLNRLFADSLRDPVRAGRLGELVKKAIENSKASSCEQNELLNVFKSHVDREWERLQGHKVEDLRNLHKSLQDRSDWFAGNLRFLVPVIRAQESGPPQLSYTGGRTVVPTGAGVTKADKSEGRLQVTDVNATKRRIKCESEPPIIAGFSDFVDPKSKNPIVYFVPPERLQLPGEKPVKQGLFSWKK